MALVKKGIVAPEPIHRPYGRVQSSAPEAIEFREQKEKEAVERALERQRARQARTKQLKEAKAQEVKKEENLLFSWQPLSTIIGKLREAVVIQVTETASYLGKIKGYVPNKLTPSETKQWNERLRSKVLEILKQAIVHDDLDKLYDDNVEVWHSAFTHPFYNPNPGKNYEVLEKLGDSVVKTAFIDYVTESRPTIDEAELTEGFNSVLSKISMGQISKSLGLPNVIRTILGTSTISINEDLFEAFYGALYQSGERTIGQGSGQGLAYDVFWWLINDGYIVLPEKFQSPYITQVNTVFTSNGWGKGPTISKEKEGPNFTVRLSLTKEAMVALSRGSKVLDVYDAKNKILYNIPYPVLDDVKVKLLIREQGLIGYGISKSLKMAMGEAYKQAYEKLKDLGILTQLNYEERRHTNQSYVPSLESSFAPALKKAVRQGYDNIVTSSKPTKVGNGYVAVLYGIRLTSEGKKNIESIFMITIPEKWDHGEEEEEPMITKDEMRITLYKLYAEYNKGEMETLTTIEFAENIEEEYEEGE